MIGPSFLHSPTMKSRHILLIAVTLASVAPCWSGTPWGEKDDTDVLRAARSYHIMFASEQSAQDAYRRLSGLQGATLFERFKATARAESKDPGSAQAGGDLGIVREGEMVKAFETALFALAPETLSKPTKSDFGWHLIYATDFSVKQVADVCAASLEGTIQRATPKDRNRLQTSKALASAPDFAERISSLIGAEWGPPLKDGDGNLTFIKTAPSKIKPDQAFATIHTEFTRAILSDAGQACQRSARAELSIDCSAKTATTTVIYAFEGRGATGRKLTESRTKQLPVPFNQGLIGQIGQTACRVT